MSIKVLEDNFSVPVAASAKYSLLAADIKEVIRNRCKNFELTDFPYAASISQYALNNKVSYIVQKEFQALTGEWLPGGKVPFLMHKVKDNDGEVHFYGRFWPERWDASIKEVSKNK